jgi:CubicO group peptidase (beta-lactamase class C family)
MRAWPRAVACLLAWTASTVLAGVAAAQIPNPLTPRPQAAPVAPVAPAGKLRPGQPIPPAELAAFVDGVMNAQMRQLHIAGAAVSVVQNGRTVLLRGYGYAAVDPHRPVDPERTLFRIGSVTKLFTWIPLSQLAEAGAVRLDAPANDYLPEALRIADGGYRQPVTLEHLMSHSAGFEDVALGHLLVLDPKHLRPLETYLATERPKRVRAPGQPSYSNYGTQLAGVIAARKFGLDYPTMVERRILQPLVMENTTAREPHPARTDLPAPMSRRLQGQLSQGFRWSGGRWKPLGFEYISHGAPAGSISASAGDMAKLMLAILRNGQGERGRIYGPRAAELFRTPLIKTPSGMNGWAHGFMTSAPAGYAAFGHDGDTDMFHTSLVTIPELDLGIFVTTNTEGGEKLATALPDLVIEHFYAPKPLGAAPAKLSQDQLRPYAGTYLGTRRAYAGLEKFVGLLQGGSIAVAKDGLLVETGGPARLMRPTAEAGVFRTADKSGMVSFDFEDGRPVRWRTGGNGQQWERARPWEQPLPFGLAACLAALAAVAALVGPFTRRRPYPATSPQRLAARMEAVAAAAWLGSAGALALWAAGSGDLLRLAVDWPGPFMTAFSILALLATLATVVSAALLLPVWRARGGDGWSLWRRLRYSATVLLFLTLAALTALRGGLEPWNF